MSEMEDNGADIGGEKTDGGSLKGGLVEEDSDSGLDNPSDLGTTTDEEPQANSSSDADDSYGAAEVSPEPFGKGKEAGRVDSSLSNDPGGSDSAVNEDETGVGPRSGCSTSKRKPVPDDLPEFLRHLAEGRAETIDFGVTLDSRPDWLDVEKFKRGQKFSSENLFSLNFAEMLSLIMLFALESALKPLIFTGKSDTPFKAFRRYLNTVLKLISWYQGDIWGEGETLAKRNISAVMSMHKNVYTNLTCSDPDDVEKKTTLGDPKTDNLWCPLTGLIAEDFRSSCPAGKVNPYKGKAKVWINQLDMSITQFGFVGLIVTYPNYFGLHYTTDEELEDFLHMWRGLGYLLGIKDKYNFCNADLGTVRQRTKDLIDATMKPAFREVSEDWEHMCRCMIRGIAFYIPVVEFESSLLYLCYTIGIDMPKLRKSVTFRQYLRFQIHRFVNFLQRIPGVLPALNKRLYALIESAQEAPPETCAKWEAITFPGSPPPKSKATTNALPQPVCPSPENEEVSISIQ